MLSFWCVLRHFHHTTFPLFFLILLPTFTEVWLLSPYSYYINIFTILTVSFYFFFKFPTAFNEHFHLCLSFSFAFVTHTCYQCLLWILLANIFVILIASFQFLFCFIPLYFAFILVDSWLAIFLIFLFRFSLFFLFPLL